MKISIALLIIMMPFASVASDLRDNLDVCSEYAKLAKMIMQKRQEGESLENMLDIVKVSSHEIDILFAAAYSKPVMLTEEWKLIYIDRFSSEAMAHCIKMMTK